MTDKSDEEKAIARVEVVSDKEFFAPRTIMIKGHTETRRVNEINAPPEEMEASSRGETAKIVAEKRAFLSTKSKQELPSTRVAIRR